MTIDTSVSETPFALKKAALPIALCFAVAAIYTLVLYYPFPRHDHWYIVTMMQASAADTLTFQDFFELHGGHWHASGYFIMVPLAQMTGFSHLAEVIASLALAILGYIGLVRILMQQAKDLSVTTHLVGLFACAAFFFFSVDQSENWLWGWQVAVFASTCGAIWAIERLTAAPVTPLNVMLAAIGAAISIYGFATGWALVPLGFGLLLLRQAYKDVSGLLSVLIWTVFSALILWHFFLAQAAVNVPYTSDAPPTGSVLEVAFQLVTYAINYVTSPVVRFSTDISIQFFFVSMGVLGWALFLLFRQKPDALTRLLPALALCGYAFGAGMVTGLGRLEQFGSDTAFLGRYLTFGNMFWIGVLSIIFLTRAYVETVPRRVFTGFLILACVMKIGSIGNVTQKTVPLAFEIRAAAEEMANCYPDVSAETMLFFEAPIQDVADRLKHLSDNDLSAFKNRGECDR